MTAEEIRVELAHYGKLLAEKDLVIGPGGNISARLGDKVYIKPSGYAFEELKPEDYVAIDVNTGELLEGDKKPSCEYPSHLACYRTRPDVQAVVHAHPPLAIGIINAGEEIRPLTPDFVAYVGKVAHLPFIIPAGQELGDAVASVIGQHNAVLLRNHGVITVGRNLKEAYLRMRLIEDAAKSILASFIIGRPTFLNEKEVEAIANLSAEHYRQALLAKL